MISDIQIIIAPALYNATYITLTHTHITGSSLSIRIVTVNHRTKQLNTAFITEKPTFLEPNFLGISVTVNHRTKQLNTAITTIEKPTFLEPIYINYHQTGNQVNIRKIPFIVIR